MSTTPYGSLRMKAESSCVTCEKGHHLSDVPSNSSPPFPAQLSPELLPYQVLVHVLVLHPAAQVVQGVIELILAQEDLGEISLGGRLGTDVT